MMSDWASPLNSAFAWSLPYVWVSRATDWSPRRSWVLRPRPALIRSPIFRRAGSRANSSRTTYALRSAVRAKRALQLMKNRNAGWTASPSWIGKSSTGRDVRETSQPTNHWHDRSSVGPYSNTYSENTLASMRRRCSLTVLVAMPSVSATSPCDARRGSRDADP